MNTVIKNQVCIRPGSERGRLIRYRGLLAIYYKDENGGSRRVSTGTNDLEEARVVLRHWEALRIERTATEIDKPAAFWLKERLRTATYHGPSRGRECNLTMDDMEAMYVRAGGRCEVSGMPFDLSVIVPGERKPYRISLDRKNSKLPYTVENCRLVSVAVNYAMGAWGESTLREIANAMAAKTVNDSLLSIRRLAGTRIAPLPTKLST